MVIGLFARADEAAECLSNLMEEDFGRADLSVIMRTPDEARAIADLAGVWNAVTPDELGRQLARRGLPPGVVQAYQEGLRRGGVVIAVQAGDAAAAAQETLGDHHATNVRVIADG